MKVINWVQTFVNYVGVQQSRLEKPLEDAEPPFLIWESWSIMNDIRISSIHASSILHYFNKNLFELYYTGEPCMADEDSEHNEHS